MNRTYGLAAAIAVVVLAGVLLVRTNRTLADPPAADKPAKSDGTKVEVRNAPALQFKMKDIDGKDKSLADYKGKVVLLVNTASKCGYTKQYAPLEALYKKYKDRGLVVIAVPADNFGHQEPGDNAEIKAFCTSKFAVTFPILSKVSVKGKDICPLYKYLTATDDRHKFGGEIPWNFTKFLINRQGEICGRYEPKVDPMKTEKFIADVEKALGPPAGAHESKPSDSTKEPTARTPS